MSDIADPSNEKAKGLDLPRRIVEGPPMLMWAVDLPAGLPSYKQTNVDVIRMFRAPDERRTSVLSGIPADEHAALLLSIATGLGRVVYHRHRLEHLADVLDARRRLVGGNYTYDTIAGFALFEFGALLSAMRAVVEEVLYTDGRAAGMTPNEADHLPTILVRTNLPAVAVIDRHRAWFDELTDYRNAMVHRGWKDTLGGFYPLGADAREARRPETNIMLLPDRASIRRPNRPHQWRYLQGLRMEDFVRRVAEEFFEVARECGVAWGEAIPAPGTLEHDWPSVVMVGQPLPLVLRTPAAIVPLFTSLENAHAFLRTVGAQVGPDVEPFAIHRGPEGEFDVGMTKRLEPRAVDGKLTVVINPEFDPAKGLVDDGINKVAVDVAVSTATDRIVLQMAPDIDVLYMLRLPPDSATGT